MKEQELKFNQEEYEIYEEFYRTLQDQKALEKDKKNPNYQDLRSDLDSSRNSLNVRMKELNKSHHEIFDALEQKVKDLVKDSNRKKKYFNAQRASDVLETRNDRYEKIKAITSKSSIRTKDLEDFFNVDVNQARQQVAQAEAQANKEEEKLAKSTGNGDQSIGDTPEEILRKFKSDYEKIIRVQASQGAKVRSLTELEDRIFKVLKDNSDSESSSNPFGDLGKDVKENLTKLMSDVRDMSDNIRNTSSAPAPKPKTTRGRKPGTTKKGNTP